MNNSRFSDDELFLLMNVPSMIGTYVASSEGSGIIGTIKEAMSNAKTVLGAVKAYPENDVIQAVLPSMEDRKEAMEHAKAFREKAVARMKEKDIDSKEKLKELLIADCHAVNELLKDKASSGEAVQYKEWAMSVAENVAKSAKEGGFLGFGGQQISPGEVAAVNSIAAALDTKSPLT